MSDLWAGSSIEHPVGKKPAEEHPTLKKPVVAACEENPAPARLLERIPCEATSYDRWEEASGGASRWNRGVAYEAECRVWPLVSMGRRSCRPSTLEIVDCRSDHRPSMPEIADYRSDRHPSTPEITMEILIAEQLWTQHRSQRSRPLPTLLPACRSQGEREAAFPSANRSREC
ncbi:hypothetical protein B296_00043563 [Ensete ventricosum]|uniref:Uncharacterized protein n=1 Tax=Ensete ventricosum TaxID=4639 RepID=A0A426Y974_ENSVE|nr:hypothetical protein B296_00043563 [Ensete ventricosum]